VYLVFQSKIEPGEVIADTEPSAFNPGWMSGAKLEQLPPSPLVLQWSPESEDGTRLSYYSAGTVMMRKDLVAALSSAGIENIDTYPVVIHSTQGRPPCHDYVAVNILGVVDAINREASSIIGDDPDLMFIESLAIDEKKAAGLLLFRLKDAENVVVIHGDVASRVKEPIFGLDCVNPADYAG
jgi:hypothetical protein